MSDFLPKNENDYEPDIRNKIVENKNLNEEIEKGLIYKKCTFKNCECNTDFNSTVFIECVFRKINFDRADLSECVFIKCKIINCTIESTIFTESDINKTMFRGCEIENCDFSGSGNFGIIYDSCDLSNLNFSDSYFDEQSIINHNTFIDNINLSNSDFNWNGHKWIECVLQKYATTEEEKNLVRQISKDRDKCWRKLTDRKNKHIKKAFRSLAEWYKENNNKGHYVPNAIKNMAKNIED